MAVAAVSHSVDEYLETIYFLAFPIGEYRLASHDSGAIASRVAEMVRVARASDGDLLPWFYDQGLVPGKELEVRSTEPAAGQLTVRLNGDERAIGEKAAAGLFVRPA